MAEEQGSLQLGKGFELSSLFILATVVGKPREQVVSI